jgi:hypothetical protein
VPERRVVAAELQVTNQVAEIALGWLKGRQATLEGAAEAPAA